MFIQNSAQIVKSLSFSHTFTNYSFRKILSLKILLSIIDIHIHMWLPIESKQNYSQINNNNKKNIEEKRFFFT